MAQDPPQVLHMVEQMTQHQKKEGAKSSFLCKKATYAVDGSDISVDSWKMTEQEYKKANLPTYARGLFTCKNSVGDQEIVIRGYDKFFNYEEVNATKWRNIEANTKGPYQLSVKENGCIIFMAGLEDGNLLVTSKHSTGSIVGGGLSHSQVGKQWVAKHLERVGKSTQDLARRLRFMNATAVAELCDDDFEEHVLAYTPDQAGLYLHGINLNLPRLVTYTVDQVDAFAAEWGFKQVQHIEKPDILAVKAFCEDIAQTGSYNGRETEGFVIRCKARGLSGTPSDEWSDWFFKFKFEEPYLLYRQWRECTRAVIAGKVPNYKKHKDITAEYLTYARQVLHGNAELREAFNQNHGIIKLRDDFLASRGTTGADIIRNQTQSQEEVTKDVVLVPVATIGCGKTTVALGLVDLFGFGHIQNDNIQGKQRPTRFASAICNLLQDHNIVIADRNNHQKRERKQIIEDVAKIVPGARFVALHYVHDDLDSLRRETRERVLTRGDNHQTIHTSKGSQEIIGIMEGFVHRFEPLNPEREPDADFDQIIDLDPTAGSRENLEIVIRKLHEAYPALIKDVPTSENMDRAVQRALDDYQPLLKHDVGKTGPKQHKTTNGNVKSGQTERKANGTVGKGSQPRTEYFAVSLSHERISSIVDAVFRDEPSNTYDTLRAKQRLQSAFHVTLIHKSGAVKHPEYWGQLSDVQKKTTREVSMTGVATTDAAGLQQPDNGSELGTCKVHLERIVFDSRVMCIVVRLKADENSEVAWRSVNDTPHITLGTTDASIKPKESNDLLQAWLAGGESNGGGPIRDVLIRGQVELTGSVKAVASRF